ncbi:MAG: hypothetical protein Q4E07_04590 [Eubacteriales bacterium]|nr:hypothetical protein [Eubacteriales bacterium]
MLRHSLERFASLCKNNKAFFAICFLCLIFAFVSFLYIQEMAYTRYLEAVNRKAETQLFFVSSQKSDALYEILKQVEENPSLPPLGVVSLSNFEYSGIYWNRSYKSDVYYTPYGRFFTDEEMSSGDNVALLSMAYLRSLPKNITGTLWDKGITIYGNHFEATGNYEGLSDYPLENSGYQTEVIPTAVAMPLKTYLNLNIPAMYLRIEFAKSLSPLQIAELKNTVSAYLDVSYVSFPNIENQSAKRIYMATSARFALILVFALISIINIIVYWVSAEFKRYRVYILCGAQKKQIIFLLAMNTIYIVSFAYIAAVFISWFLTSNVPEGLVNMLPVKTYFLIYISSLIFLLITVNIKAAVSVFDKRRKGNAIS